MESITLTMTRADLSRILNIEVGIHLVDMNTCSLTGIRCPIYSEYWDTRK